MPAERLRARLPALQFVVAGSRAAFALWFYAYHMRRILLTCAIVLLSLASNACREEGVVIVRRLQFVGVSAVDESRLRSVLATRQSARLPWSRKQLFNRTRFEADLKRIEAFYGDRGYPDARVTSFDVQLSDEQDAVDVTLTVFEGDPVLVAAIEFIGFTVIPPYSYNDLKNRIPLQVGHPRDRQQVIAAGE